MRKKLRIPFLTVVLLGFVTILRGQDFKYQFQNYNLSFEQRVDDLVARLTLEEKVAQMLNSAPAIPRLGIPAYDWWNEVLHGVARTPYKVTVYPQAIAMAASFDKEAVYRMADFSAMEGRAVYNEAVKDGRQGRRYVGLTYWTPNVNIFRDPRWGRGQETYGEDPFLTSQIGDAFVRGLQGDDPKYLKAAACAKHYAVHSGPEPLRHHFDVDVSAHDLWDTYLPAFEKLVVDSKVAGVMCAYNAFRTQPCCASDILMNDILRKKWGFTGYVTSDCAGIEDFFTKHKTHPDAASASVDAVFHGTDVECGKGAYLSLTQAVKDGMISEAQIDQSVKRLFMIRFRLGLFDPAEMVKYAQTSADTLESLAHQQHALDLARASMVLLKNDRLLPLQKNLKKIVVLGPNGNNSVSILGNYNGTPSALSTVYQGIKDKVGAQTEVVYEKAITFTDDRLLNYENFAEQFVYEGKKGFKAEYYKNVDLEGDIVASRFETNPTHSWQEGESVVGNLTANDFSARYTTNLYAKENQSLSLEMEADNGCRLFINDKLVVDDWIASRRELKRYNLEIEKGKSYKIVLEFWQGDGNAGLKFRVGNYVKTDYTQLVERYKDADLFVFAGGISPELEGESMRVSEPGFVGGDKESILLPAVQTSLMKALKASGKPVIFVMMTGSAIATPWESENIPVILNAWYGGQAAGQAVADILFGDFNPSGRLPVTFYKSDTDLPDFVDYSMKNRTYRYFKGQPLYGFGYGLSFTRFDYGKIRMRGRARQGKPISVSTQVKNVGDRSGDEIVQLYVSAENGDGDLPLKSLKAFEKIHLSPGETKEVKFLLSADDLSYIDANGEKKSLSGKVRVAVGGRQPDESNTSTSDCSSAIVFVN